MCVMGHLGLWGHGGGGVCLDEGQWGCVGVGIGDELQPLPDPAGGGGVGLVEGELLRLSPSLLREGFGRFSLSCPFSWAATSYFSFSLATCLS